MLDFAHAASLAFGHHDDSVVQEAPFTSNSTAKISGLPPDAENPTGSGSHRQCHLCFFPPLQFQCQPPCQPITEDLSTRKTGARYEARLFVKGVGGIGL